MLQRLQIDVRDATLSRAERLLRAHFECGVRLHLVEELESAHRVLRCRVVNPGPGLPASVVIKHLKREDDALLFPPRRQFLNELASLRFLRDLPVACGPHLYASDAAERLMVIEDLGEGPSLQDILIAGETARATFHLTALGGLLGRMQEAAARRQAVLSALQSSLGVSNARCGGSMDVRDRRSPRHACLDSRAVARPDGFDEAVAAVGAAMIDDSIWRTLVHFDAGPHNCIQTDGTLKLFDFEFAGLGNGLIDVVGARMAFPVAYHGRRLPAPVVEALESSYRVERLTTIPQAAETDFFRSALAHACAHWALTKLWGFWKDYLHDRWVQGPDYDARDGWDPERAAYFRQMVFTYLFTFVETARRWACLPALRAVLARVMAALRVHWPDLEPWPFYPAFAGWAPA